MAVYEAEVRKLRVASCKLITGKLRYEYPCVRFLEAWFCVKTISQ